MDEGRVLAIAQHLGANALAVPVDVKLDGGGWNNASQTWAKTTEKGSPALSFIDVANY